MLDKIFKKKTPIKKVLLVEDDALLIKVLRDRLLDEKYEVTTVNNGIDATATATKLMPDVILLDLIIPGLDGFGVLKQLKAETKTAKIPVVVLSNLSNIGDIKSTKALGADEYFIKSNTSMQKIIDYINKTI